MATAPDPSVPHCIICGRTDNLEGHHVIPICYGGDKNGVLINVCETCHANIHRTAESMCAKTAEHKSFFLTKELLKRAAPYVKAVIDAKRNYQEGNVSQDLRKRRLIIVEMTDFEWKRLHKRKLDCGYKNLKKFIQDLLIAQTKM